MSSIEKVNVESTKQAYAERYRNHFCDLHQDANTSVAFEDVRVVKVKKSHQCLGAFASTPIHIIPVGALALRDTAKVNGELHSTYRCLSCVDLITKEPEA